MKRSLLATMGGVIVAALLAGCQTSTTNEPTMMSQTGDQVTPPPSDDTLIGPPRDPDYLDWVEDK